MRKISADYIFPVSSPPIKNGIIVVDEGGIIHDVLKPETVRLPTPIVNDVGQGSRPSADINSKRSRAGMPGAEHYEGVIVPCFINTHCHLELSYLKDKISRGKGLDEFVREVEEVRGNFSKEQIQEALVKAENEMIRNGIVAVGDISNSDHSFRQKAKKRLKYHTFIEVLGFHPDKAEREFQKGKQLRVRSSEFGIRSSITPHSAYASSEKLLSLINEHSSNEILTFHNQESEEENLLFRNKSGKILSRLEKWGIDTGFFQPTKTNSLQFILPKLHKAKKILLVHDTYTSKEDMDWLKFEISNFKFQIYFCFCPNANLYIENKLPNIPMFLENGMNIAIGTDSLASNNSLSILDELKTISKHFPKIPFETLIAWATKNGAEIFGMEKEIGTIEKGKRPGLNLIRRMDENLQLSSASSVQRIL